MACRARGRIYLDQIRRDRVKTTQDCFMLFISSLNVGFFFFFTISDRDQKSFSDADSGEYTGQLRLSCCGKGDRLPLAASPC